MTWRTSGPMDERLQFVRDALRDRFAMSELCARYGVSRRIGYKRLARYDADGRRGLADRRHVPHHARTRSSPPWRRCSSRSGVRIRTGARGSSSRGKNSGCHACASVAACNDPVPCLHQGLRCPANARNSAAARS